jgi:uracil-DNA glycosylase family 4
VTPPESLAALSAQIVECRRCPRLVAWREETAREKRAAYREEDYWGRPVPGFGDPNARLLVVGLAPAAHGANRTGRMFTGDRSGDWLFRALHRAGFANQPTSTRLGDGLRLSDAWVTAPVRCAPPENRPTTDERDACSGWFDEELRLLRSARVVVCLGGYGYQALWSALRRRGIGVPSPRPTFGHGVRVGVDDLTVLLSYHPSQQNTFTGRLTESMFDAVFAAARAEIAAGGDALG